MEMLREILNYSNFKRIETCNKNKDLNNKRKKNIEITSN